MLKSVETNCSMRKGNMVCDRDGYGKAEYMSEENIKEGIWTSSRTRKLRITIEEELRELCKDLDIVTDTKRKRWDGLGIW
jgi:hypothetical protein